MFKVKFRTLYTGPKPPSPCLFSCEKLLVAARRVLKSYRRDSELLIYSSSSRPVYNRTRNDLKPKHSTILLIKCTDIVSPLTDACNLHMLVWFSVPVAEIGNN